MERQIPRFTLTKEMRANQVPLLCIKRDKEGNDKSYIQYKNWQGEKAIITCAEQRRQELKKKIFQPRPRWVTKRSSDGINHVYDANRVPLPAAIKEQGEEEKRVMPAPVPKKKQEKTEWEALFVA